jgi:hypothetical protein
MRLSPFLTEIRPMLRILSVLAGLLLFSFTPHTFYVSHTTVFHNVQEQNMEVTIRLFTHDLEWALTQDDRFALHIGDENESAVADHLVRDYILKHFSMRMNGVPVNLSYVGKETENDRLYVYFEFPPPAAFSTVEMDNTLLTEVFPEQKNYLSLEIAGWRQSLVFTRTQPSQVVTR